MALEARKWVFRCSRERSADLWQDEEDIFYTLNDSLFAWLVTSHGCPLHPPGKLFRFPSFFGMKLVLSTISVCCLETLTIFYLFWSGFCWLGVIETKLLISLILSSTSGQSRPSRLMLSFPQSAGDNGTEPNREVTQGLVQCSSASFFWHTRGNILLLNQQLTRKREFLYASMAF